MVLRDFYLSERRINSLAACYEKMLKFAVVIIF